MKLGHDDWFIFFEPRDGEARGHKGFDLLRAVVTWCPGGSKLKQRVRR